MQPPRLSSTRMGFGGAAATLILNLNGVRRRSRHTYRAAPRLSSTCMGSGGAAATFILNLNGAEWSREVQPLRLSSTRTRLGTRPQDLHAKTVRLSSTSSGSQACGPRRVVSTSRRRRQGQDGRTYPQPTSGPWCVVPGA